MLFLKKRKKERKNSQQKNTAAVTSCSVCLPGKDCETCGTYTPGPAPVL